MAATLKTATRATESAAVVTIAVRCMCVSPIWRERPTPWNGSTAPQCCHCSHEWRPSASIDGRHERYYAVNNRGHLKIAQKKWHRATCQNYRGIWGKGAPTLVTDRHRELAPALQSRAPHSSLGYKPPAPEVVAWPASPAVEGARPAIRCRALTRAEAPASGSGASWSSSALLEVESSSVCSLSVASRQAPPSTARSRPLGGREGAALSAAFAPRRTSRGGGKAPMREARPCSSFRMAPRRELVLRRNAAHILQQFLVEAVQSLAQRRDELLLAVGDRVQPLAKFLDQLNHFRHSATPSSGRPNRFRRCSRCIRTQMRSHLLTQRGIGAAGTGRGPLTTRAPTASE